MSKRLLSKPSVPDTCQAFKVRSKSTPNVSRSRPVKPPPSPLSESHVNDDDIRSMTPEKSSSKVNTKLKKKIERRKQATELVHQLQKDYDNLLSKCAQAKLTSDQIRPGAKMSLTSEYPVPGQMTTGTVLNPAQPVEVMSMEGSTSSRASMLSSPHSPMSESHVDDDDIRSVTSEISSSKVNKKLKKELERRKQTTKLVHQLQKDCNNLLSKFAQAKLTSEQMRSGAKISLHAESSVPGQMTTGTVLNPTQPVQVMSMEGSTSSRATILSSRHSPMSGDNLYDGLSSPTFETAVPATEDTVIIDPVDQERQKEEWRDELAKVESEILTLRKVLGAKVRYATELKRKLGISPLVEFKQDFQHGIQEIKGSDMFQKTSAAAKAAATKTNTAFSSFGGAVSRKLGDIRNSRTFKSMEERVGDTYQSVKAKVSGSKSTDSFEEALRSQQENSDNSRQEVGEPVQIQPLPEEKVPL